MKEAVKQTLVRIDEKQLAEVRKYADFMGVSMTSVVREAVQSFLEVQAQVRMETRLAELNQIAAGSA